MRDGGTSHAIAHDSPQRRMNASTTRTELIDRTFYTSRTHQVSHDHAEYQACLEVLSPTPSIAIGNVPRV